MAPTLLLLPMWMHMGRVKWDCPGFGLPKMGGMVKIKLPRILMLDNDWLLECELKYFIVQLYNMTNVHIVYWVNWLRAQAQTWRWEEEYLWTEREMIWTTLYFMHQRDKWYGQLINLHNQGSSQRGHEAYCEQMIAQWEEYARLATFQFWKANPVFLRPGLPLSHLTDTIPKFKLLTSYKLHVE